MGLFKGADCLHVAEFLAGRVNGPCTLESTRRAAISRAYYAAYGHAFHYEVDNGRFIPTKDPNKRGQDHGRLKRHFQNMRKTEETQIATELEELHIWRKLCDYEKIVMEPVPVVGILDKAAHVVTYL